MADQALDWNLLSTKYGAILVDAVRRHFAGGPFQIRARQLAVEANADDDASLGLLQELSAAGLLTIQKLKICPCEQQHSLTEDQASADVCGQCGLAFGTDIQGRPSEVITFVRRAPETRDVRWMVALHGMNTSGAWQEDFNWLLSRTYGRSVPVAIYKYGIVRPGAILKFRQRALMRGLNARIRRLSGDTTKTGFGGVPDVIAHSLGTWLLGHALKDDPSLRVGRIILTGSILRPDFDWGLLLGRQQVQAVMCHSATKDFWARISHYIVPDSGPSGRRGFNDRSRVTHAVVSDGAHSDFFKEDVMPVLFDDVWQPFLTRTLGQQVLPVNALPAPDWRQAWWPFRATVLRFFLLFSVAAIILTALAALALGLVDIWRLLAK